MPTPTTSNGSAATVSWPDSRLHTALVYVDIFSIEVMEGLTYGLSGSYKGYVGVIM